MVDRNIGKILRTVNDLGLGDDLLVLFTTDHGDLMFDHGCIEKTILYERSIRVPFVVSGPGSHPANQDHSSRVTSISCRPCSTAWGSPSGDSGTSKGEACCR